MTSTETPIVERPAGPPRLRISPVVDRPNGCRIGRVVRSEVPSSGRHPIVQWWAETDDGRRFGPARRRRDVVGRMFAHYRRWDSFRYAFKRMGA